jgi:hypothetical protein
MGSMDPGDYYPSWILGGALSLAGSGSYSDDWTDILVLDIVISFWVLYGFFPVCGYNDLLWLLAALDLVINIFLLPPLVCSSMRYDLAIYMSRYLVTKHTCQKGIKVTVAYFIKYELCGAHLLGAPPSHPHRENCTIQDSSFPPPIPQCSTLKKTISITVRSLYCEKKSAHQLLRRNRR